MEKDKDISQMGEKELKKEYEKMVSGIGNSRIYDGRGKGIDIYHCDKCQTSIFTRYKEKGVTPYIIPCEQCGWMMRHMKTVEDNVIKRQEMVRNWVRPSFDQMKGMGFATIAHVLKGGLVLEDEIK